MGDYEVLFGAIILFGVSLVWIFHVVRSRNWSQTEGVITISNVKTNFLSRTMSRYHEVAFRYSVNGQEFVGFNKRPGNMGQFEWIIGGIFGSADSEKRKLPIGKAVTVYYNPKYPKDSALELGNFAAPFILFGVSFIFLLWALLRAVAIG